MTQDHTNVNCVESDIVEDDKGVSERNVDEGKDGEEKEIVARDENGESENQSEVKRNESQTEEKSKQEVAANNTSGDCATENALCKRNTKTNCDDLEVPRDAERDKKLRRRPSRRKGTPQRLRKASTQNSTDGCEKLSESDPHAIVEESTEDSRDLPDGRKKPEAEKGAHTAETSSINATSSGANDDRTVSSKEATESGDFDRSSRRRVKVYVLNKQGNWDDSITGYVSWKKIAVRDGKGTDLNLQIINETNGVVSLNYRVKKFHEALYQMQGTTIITWSEKRPETSSNERSPHGEMALSFAEASGCKDVWDEINKAQAQCMSSDTFGHQRRNSGGHVQFLTGPSGALLDEELDISATAAMNWANRIDESCYADASLSLLANGAQAAEMYAEGEAASTAIEFNMPNPVRSELTALANLFGAQSPLQLPSARQCVATEFKNNKYVEKLLEVFRQCEDLEDLDGLRCLYCIFRGTCFLGDPHILRECLKAENFMDVVGALEYDPSHLPSIPSEEGAREAAIKKIIPLKRHRTQLEEGRAFRSVVDIKDSNILKKIHENYRLMFIRDVALPHAMDDMSLGSFQGFLHINNVDIIYHLISTKEPLEDLFEQFRSHIQLTKGNSKPKEGGVRSSPEDKPKNNLHTLLRFVMELFMLTRFVQHQERVCVMARFLSKGLLGILCFAMKSTDLKVRHVATDIVLELTRNDFALMRLHRYAMGVELKIGRADQIVVEEGNQAKLQTTSAITREDESESSFDLQQNASSDSQDADKDDEDGKRRRSSTGSEKTPPKKGQGKETTTGTSGFLETLFDMLCSDEDAGLVMQANEIIRHMVNPDAISLTPEKELFMTFLYSKCVPRLLNPLKRVSSGSSTNTSEKPPLSHNLSYVCDVFYYIIAAHGYRAKYFVLGNDLVKRVLNLVDHAVGDIRLSVIRVLRATVGAKDDAYDRYLTNNKLFKPVIDLFVKNKYRDNITNSTVLEMISFCVLEQREKLLSVFVEEYGAELEPSTKHSQVFKQAKQTLQALKANEPIPVRDQSHVPYIARGPPQINYGQTDALTMFPMHDEDEEYFANSDVSDILNDKLSDSSAQRLSLSSSNPFTSNLGVEHYDGASMFDDSSLPLRSGRFENSTLFCSEKEGTGATATDQQKERLSVSARKVPPSQEDEALAAAFPDSCLAFGASNAANAQETNSLPIISKRRRPQSEIEFKDEEPEENKVQSAPEKESEGASNIGGEGASSPTKRRRLSGNISVKESGSDVQGTQGLSRREGSIVIGESSSHEVGIQSSMAPALAET
eukprot:Plantae.Rhodophyta-Hildenbrandia_rubra.ctg9542.p1 GENE.Plantae.Rhodophyta-Hildenbrandia_rubra.ctg9542~~Plantae.Rhodophyta-Hildenbrandia_rubra.ctg9542.p1  ORF type:complete len:1287 (-),score=224.81 Plantae.Rhodophyta-Hildenbrandia_rubra.ctg9542:362-4222(-)